MNYLNPKILFESFSQNKNRFSKSALQPRRLCLLRTPFVAPVEMNIEGIFVVPKEAEELPARKHRRSSDGTQMPADGDPLEGMMGAMASSSAEAPL